MGKASVIKKKKKLSTKLLQFTEIFQHLIYPKIKTLPSRETDENKDNSKFLIKTNA